MFFRYRISNKILNIVVVFLFFLLSSLFLYYYKLHTYYTTSDDDVEYELYIWTELCVWFNFFCLRNRALTLVLCAMSCVSPTKIWLLLLLVSSYALRQQTTWSDTTKQQPSYRQYLEFALKLGYPEKLIQTALSRLGGSPTNNELLAELIKLGAQPGSNGKYERRERNMNEWKENDVDSDDGQNAPSFLFFSFKFFFLHIL